MPGFFVWAMSYNRHYFSFFLLLLPWKMLGISFESSSFFTFMTLEICRLICPIKLVFKDTRLYRYYVPKSPKKESCWGCKRRTEPFLSFGTDHLLAICSFSTLLPCNFFNFSPLCSSRPVNDFPLIQYSVEKTTYILTCSVLILPPKLGYGGSILLRSRSVCTYFENGVLIGSQLFISTYTLLPSFSRLITVIRYNYLNTHYTLLFIIVTIPRWERDISGALDNENCKRTTGGWKSLRLRLEISLKWKWNKIGFYCFTYCNLDMKYM